MQYMDGNYDVWDPKITTPPGLYYFQIPFTLLLGKQLWVVRSINCLVFGNLFLVFSMKIFQFMDHNKNNMSRSLNLALTPTLYFFFFLDYTDIASLSFITMAFYYCLVGSAWRMGICSLFAVYARQNNIIWCAYLLMYRIVSVYSASVMNIRGNVLMSVVSFTKLMLVNFKDIIRTNYVQISVFPIFGWYLYKYNNGRLVFGDH